MELSDRMLDWILLSTAGIWLLVMLGSQLYYYLAGYTLNDSNAIRHDPNTFKSEYSLFVAPWRLADGISILICSLLVILVTSALMLMTITVFLGFLTSVFLIILCRRIRKKNKAVRDSIKAIVGSNDV